MLTEPWIVDPGSMAPRTNTSPQLVESKSKARTRTGERRRFTNHLTPELYRCCQTRACGCTERYVCIIRPTETRVQIWAVDNLACPRRARLVTRSRNPYARKPLVRKHCHRCVDRVNAKGNLGQYWARAVHGLPELHRSNRAKRPAGELNADCNVVPAHEDLLHQQPNVWFPKTLSALETQRL